MSKQTSITIDIEYHIERIAVGRRVEIVPIIDTIDSKPASDYPPTVISMVLERLYSDDNEFADEIDKAKVA
jgi:hypothetical protein